MAQFEVGIHGLDVGNEEVLGNSFDHFASLRAGDLTGFDQVLDEESAFVGASKREGIQEQFTDDLLLLGGTVRGTSLGGVFVDGLKSFGWEDSQSVDNLDSLWHGVLGGGWVTGNNVGGKRVQVFWDKLDELGNVGLSIDVVQWDVKRSLETWTKTGLWDTEFEFLVLLWVLDAGNHGLLGGDHLFQGKVLAGGHQEFITEIAVDDATFGLDVLNNGDWSLGGDVVLDPVVALDWGGFGLLTALAASVVWVVDGVGDLVVSLDGGEAL